LSKVYANQKRLVDNKGDTMNDVEFLLTDEYVEYAQDIAGIHKSRKAKEEDMKRTYDAYKEDMEILETEAKTRHLEWEAWKAEQVGNSSVEE
jgi:hypothetical protein